MRILQIRSIRKLTLQIQLALGIYEIAYRINKNLSPRAINRNKTMFVEICLEKLHDRISKKSPGN